MRDYVLSHDLNFLRETIESTTEDRLFGVLSEIVRTHGDLRSNVTPRYRFDERWEDLKLCLSLDGYLVTNSEMAPFDPTIEANQTLEDDLSREIRQCGFTEAGGILSAMENSADAFRRNPPDYNACLSNARVALQTVAKSIALARQEYRPASFDENSWGQVLAYLRTSEFITVEEEAGLAGVFRFVSPGAHRPVALNEQEVARLGRSLAACMCYFLVRQYREAS